MWYYHVWIERKSCRKDEFRLDLTIDEVNERLVAPYHAGEPIVITGKSIPIDDIRNLQINLTTQPSHELEPKLRELQEGQSALVGNSMALLVATSGIEVTDRLINRRITGSSDVPGPKTLSSLFERLITNQLLREASHQLFSDGHYSRAVEEAFKCLNNTVKDKSGLKDRDGASLMRMAFSASTPVLYLNGIHSQSEKDEQQGYMDIFAGVMTGIRNPRVHEHDLVDQPEVALELLVLANHLMRRLDSTTKNKPTS